MNEDFDWRSFLDRLWERENSTGFREIEGKGGYRNGRYYPYVTPNGNTDIGPGFDMSKQTPDFQRRARTQGFTKKELENIAVQRLRDDSQWFYDRIQQEGGNPRQLTNDVYGGLLDMQWQLGKSGLEGYNNFWKAVAAGDYDKMREESVVKYKDPQGVYHIDTGRRDFRNDTYFHNPTREDTISLMKNNIIRPILFQRELPVTSVEAVPQPSFLEKAANYYHQMNDKVQQAQEKQDTPTESWAHRIVERFNSIPTYIPKKLKPKWEDLSMWEKAAMMNVAIKNKIYSRDEIKKKYNQFAEGGELEENTFAEGGPTGYIYDVLPQMLRRKGLDVRVSSGYRSPKANSKFSSGNKSWHIRHGAVDIVPQGKTTFADIEHVLYNDPEVVNYMLTNGFGLLDESGRTEESRATMKRTKATGPHFHIGKDSKPAARYASRMRGVDLSGVAGNNAFNGHFKLNGQNGLNGQYEQNRVVGFTPYNAEILANPEGFLASYQAPVVERVPEQPLVQAADAYSEAELARQERQDKWNKFNFLMGLLQPVNNNNGQEGSFLNTLQMLAGNQFAEGGPLKKILKYINGNGYKYRNQPTDFVPTRFGLKIGPQRQRENTSPTQEESEKIEDANRRMIMHHQTKSGGSNPAYDLVYDPDKSILIKGSTTSTNLLDSLAKYTAIYNADPQLSENPIFPKEEYGPLTEVPVKEIIGLSSQETRNGAWPFINIKGSADKQRAIGNSNYLTAYGYIPADNFMRNFHYNDTKVSRDTPPLLDAIQYYAQGDYNRGDPGHTPDVRAMGDEVWKLPAVQKWWNSPNPMEGRNGYNYWFNKAKYNR